MSNTDNYLKLFNYLLEFARLRERVIREIEKFEEHVWLKAVPQQRGYHCVLWDEGEAREGLEWLKYKKPHRPNLPDPPEKVLPWIKSGSLQVLSPEPSLLPEIIEDGQTVSLKDHPEVRTAFLRYLEGTWKSWSVKFAEYQKLSETYNALFRMYERSTKFAEEYELIVGIGLAFFRSKGGQLVKRHILVSNAALVFHPEKELFLLSVGADGANLRFESDMILDLEIGDVVDAERKGGEYLREHELLEVPFSEDVKDSLRVYINTLSPDGEFVDTSELPRQVSSDPALFYCPALILRKRTLKAMTSMMQSIVTFLGDHDGMTIPMLDDLFGSSDDGSTEEMKIDVGTGSHGGVASEDRGPRIVYFPKRWNDEQMSIVKRISSSDKVLVQGPPGTGKSHTIANLISHLLAQGKRVLVTAFTKRALQVLKNQLPEPIKPLCVNLLGNDRASIHDLESSVRSIISRINGYDLRDTETRVKRLENEWRELVSEKEEHEKQIIALRCRHTSQHRVNAAYEGTLMEIALSVQQDASEYSWFEDQIEDLSGAEAAAELVAQLYDLKEKLSGRDEVDLTGDIPMEDHLPDTDVLAAYFEQKKALDELRRGFPMQGDSSWVDSLQPLGSEELQALEKKLRRCEDAYRALATCSLPWAAEAISECLNGYDKIWDDLHKTSKKVLIDELKEAIADVETRVTVRLLSEIPWERVHLDASHLADYLAQGHNLKGISVLKPKKIRACLPLVQSTLVNEHAPVSVDDFKALAVFARARDAVSRLQTLWQDRVPRSQSLVLQLSQFETAVAELSLILENSKHVLEARAALRRHLKDSSFALAEDKVPPLLYACRMAEKSTAFEPLSLSYDELIQRLTALARRAGAHPVIDQIFIAVEKSNLKEYDRLRKVVHELREARLLHAKYIDTRKKAQVLLPKTTAKIDGGDPAVTRPCLEKISGAMSWSNAKHYLHRAARSREEEELENRVRVIEDQVSQLTADAAALRAWQHLVKTMKPAQRQELMAWFQAVKKIGKGTGKNAAKFRRLAQQHMNSCKDVIPAWVMPLYRVAETVTPEPGIYDCVIIDEASQLGPDALFLLYLAKKIVIVGDDKQTSPEYVGVSKDAVNQIIVRHLQGVPYREFYGSESSFFDHAERFCEIKGGKIVLKEHFRCMPEIIRFSNDHFYAPFGAELLPMRQYSELRLEPKKAVYVRAGHTEGQARNLINRAEAEAIASQIAECLKDESYTGKNFGVISLQGQKQADLISDLLLEKIGAEAIEERRLVCGISSSFQGDERHVVMLSMVVSPEYNFRALTMPGDERRFNVAASRAKDQIWLFHSVGRNDLANQDDLRFKIYEFFYQDGHAEEVPPVVTTGQTVAPPFESALELAVYQDLVEKGYRVIPQYRVGQFRLDLALVLKNGMKVAVECDGDKNHGEAEYAHDMMRQRVLERCGWHFFRIRGYEYFHDKERVLQQLWNMVDRYDRLVLVERPVAEIRSEILEEVQESVEVEEQLTAGSVSLHEDTVVLPAESDIVDSLDLREELESREVEITPPSPDITNVGGYFLGSDVTDVQREWFASLVDIDWISLLKSIKAEDTLFSWEERLLVSLSLYNTTGEEVTGRMIHDLEALARRVPEIWNRSQPSEQKVKAGGPDEPVERQLELSESEGMNESEVRLLLYAVRDEIHANWPDVPWERGILRKTMLEKFVKHRITTMGDFRRVFSGRDLARTHLGQMQFLDRIFAIIKQMRL